MGMIRRVFTLAGVVAVGVAVYKNRPRIQGMMHQRQETMGHKMVSEIESGADAGPAGMCRMVHEALHRRMDLEARQSAEAQEEP